MNAELLKETIKRELPGLLRDDPALRAYILELTRQEYAGRAETEDRFYAMLAELRCDREEQSRKWDEQNHQWDEQNHQWDEHQAQIREEFQQVHEEIMAQAKKHDRSIGALGARWGTHAIGSGVPQCSGRDSGAELRGAGGEC